MRAHPIKFNRAEVDHFLFRRNAAADRTLNVVRFCYFFDRRLLVKVPFMPEEELLSTHVAEIVSLSINHHDDPVGFVMKSNALGFHVQLSEAAEGGICATMHQRCCGYGSKPFQAEVVENADE